MRLLCTSHTAKLTGSAMSLYTLLTGLGRQEVEARVLLAEDGPLRERLQQQGFGLDVLRHRGWRKALTPLRAAALLRRHGTELVYLNCVVGFSAAVARAAAHLGIPVVWHVREPPDSPRVQRYKPVLFRCASTVVVVSEELRRAMQGPAPVRKVDNGVDLDRFAPGLDGSGFRAEHGLPADAFVFGVVGTIEERKGTALFVDAAQRLLAHGHDTLHFLVVGRGRGAYHDALRARVQTDALLRSRVHFTGEIWNVPQALAAIDCLVMPSRWEGFPRVLLEAMSVGTPAIATDVGDVRYMLQDGRTGRVVPPGDLALLVDAMADALAQRDDLRTMGALASADARSRFSQQAHAQRMAQVLRDTLAGGDSVAA